MDLERGRQLIMDSARIQERRFYGNNLADHTYFIAHRSITHVALQFRLGILPERWFRARSADHYHIAGPGTDMTFENESPRVR
jgi:hypothetical protein